MRKNNDRRDKVQIKKEIFEKNIKGLNIFLVFENDETLL